MKTTSYPIFLVDDDLVYLKSIKDYLASHLKIDVRFYTFSSGEECLKSMHLHPKIIILDYFLNSSEPSAENGLSILKKIKQIDPNVEVVMLSYQDNMKVATDIMKFGAFDYVSKNENAHLRIEHAIKNIHKMIIQDIVIGQTAQIKYTLIAVIIIMIGGAVAIQIYYPELMNRV